MKKYNQTLPSFIVCMFLVGCANQNVEDYPNEGVDDLPATPHLEVGWQENGKDSGNSANTKTVTSPQIKHQVVKKDIYTSPINTNPEVVRYDRYTLISSAPKGGQKYLLEQMVNVNMGKSYSLSVEQGLWNTLKGTGFTLCTPTNPEVANLFSLQLPKVHYKFGPMKLRDSLQMLAGEAYELSINYAYRQICYKPRKDIPEPNPNTPKVIDNDVLEM